MIRDPREDRGMEGRHRNVWNTPKMVEHPDTIREKNDRTGEMNDRTLIYLTKDTNGMIRGSISQETIKDTNIRMTRRISLEPGIMREEEKSILGKNLIIIWIEMTEEVSMDETDITEGVMTTDEN